MLNLLKHYTMKSLKNEKGQGMVEYALLIGLIAIVVIAALVVLGPQISSVFEAITTRLSGVGI